VVVRLRLLRWCRRIGALRVKRFIEFARELEDAAGVSLVREFFGDDRPVARRARLAVVHLTCSFWPLVRKHRQSATWNAAGDCVYGRGEFSSEPKRCERNQGRGAYWRL